MTPLRPETIAEGKADAERLDSPSYYGWVSIAEQQAAEIDRLQSQLTQARERLAKIVVTEGEDAGVVLLSSDGPTHLETRTNNGVERTVDVYDHAYFSPLGDALVELWEGLANER